MRGRRKTLKISEAEWSIMMVLWDGCEEASRGMTGVRGLTLGEIVGRLADTSDWSSTTIRTLLIRLSEKGAVVVDKTTGVYKYTPATQRKECIRSEVDSFVERVFSGQAGALVRFLLTEDKLTAAEREELLQLLRE